MLITMLFIVVITFISTLMLVYTIVANTMLTSCCRGTAVVIAISAARLVHDSSGLAELQHDFGSQAAWRRTALVCIPGVEHDSEFFGNPEIAKPQIRCAMSRRAPEPCTLNSKPQKALNLAEHPNSARPGRDCLHRRRPANTPRQSRSPL